MQRKRKVIGSNNNIRAGDPAKDDFFEINPELKYITQFSALVKKEGRKEASKLMWAVDMVLNPDSAIYNLSTDERYTEVAENYLGDAKFDWSAIEELMSTYMRLALSKEAALLAERVALYERTLLDIKIAPLKDRLSFLTSGTKAEDALDILRSRYEAKKADRYVKVSKKQQPGMFGKKSSE